MIGGKFGLAAVLCTVLATAPPWPAAAQGLVEKPAKPGPLKPGGLRISVQNPLPGNWVCKGITCVCKPMACGSAVLVDYTAKPTPARKPDPQALERFAKVDIPKALKAANAAQNVLSDGKNKIELVGTRVSKALGRPAVDVESKSSNGEKTIHNVAVMIFAGPALVTVTAKSNDRAAAQKGLKEYLTGMTIQEGPSVAPKLLPNPPDSVGREPADEFVPSPRAPVKTPST